MRTLGILSIGILAVAALGAQAVQVDYYAGNALNSSNPLNLAHVIVAIGGDGDKNGPGSRDPQVGGPVIGNGIPDGVEFSALEYVYDNPGVTNHATVVSIFDSNLTNMWNAYGCPGDSIAFWGQHAQVYCDAFGGAPEAERICWDANLCIGNAQPFCLRATADQTVSVDTEFYANFHYLLCFGLGAPNPRTPYDFENGMTVSGVTRPAASIDRSLLPLLGVNGDFDNDGITNIDEWNALVSAVRAVTPTWADPVAADDILWDTIPVLYGTTSSRGSKDQMIGWYIDAALLNQAFDPPLFDLATGTPGSGGGDGDANISITNGGWVEEGSRAEITASLDGATGYQWFKDGAVLFGETGAQVVFDPVALSDAGQYFCRITTPAKATVDTPTVTLQVFSTGTLPVAGGVGLGILAGLLTLTGIARYRRRK